MEKIYKYKVQPLDCPSMVELQLPFAAQILSAEIQDGWIVLWAKFNPIKNDETMPFRIHCVFTGENIPFGCHRHIATLTDTLGLVWHVFEQHQGTF